ncbi:DUF3954 domain-containing protein [Rummeliibacillus stabekisii]|uniref:DUF3954 domain-containing protein n=1 Tax=Rummeliibacillus stabekisii TaxID=241244 RepID=A0A143HC64_9BACL|nr:DUF3954 domain-containing protein [Rummeliibacillus stabekisii]AMW99324.1 hypothetical protein ATY39_07515 [Rummeliibacillus stabekisii]
MSKNEDIKAIDLSEDAVYVVCDNKITKLDSPSTGFGKQEVTWQKGKPTHSEIKYTQMLF